MPPQIPGDWTNWQTLTPGGQGCQFTETIASGPQRLYRVIQDEPSAHDWE
ncbi:MAG: hypothetical protein KJ070_08320 [Verrucomicrobia bacterium]|nr:hypothetical protein [Verrucomicrobiota bacterium]